MNNNLKSDPNVANKTAEGNQKQFDIVDVSIVGRTQVQLRQQPTSAMEIFSDDPALMREITAEAVRLGVGEQLAGFHGVRVIRPPGASVKTPAAQVEIDFVELGKSISRLVAGYNALIEQIEHMQQPLADIEKAIAEQEKEQLCTEASDGNGRTNAKIVQGAVQTLRRMYDSIQAAQSEGEDQAAQAVNEAAQRNKEATEANQLQQPQIPRMAENEAQVNGGFAEPHDNDDGEIDEEEEEEQERTMGDPAAMGYMPITSDHDGEE